MSSTAFVKNGEFYLASRNRVIYRDKLSRAKKLFTADSVLRGKFEGRQPQAVVAANWLLPQALSEFDYEYAIQWETAGPGIQKNKLKLKDYQGLVFNVYDMKKRKYLSVTGVITSCQAMRIQHVDLVCRKTFDWKTPEELIEFSKGNYKYFTFGEKLGPREGIVIRDDEGDEVESPENKMNAMWSFKVINPEFKMKYQDD
jgi:hypothetical protein